MRRSRLTMRTSRCGERLRNRHRPVAVEFIVEPIVEDAPRPHDGRTQPGGQLVSVIVPVHNVEEHLEQCVESLLGQTHEHLQVLLVDDGSTDRSGERCDALAAADPRVEVIHQASGGPSAARNAGLAVARGSWLFFVDSDDWVHPDSISVLLTAAVSANADVAVGGFQRVAPRGAPVGEAVLPERHDYTSGEALSGLMGPLHTLLTVVWGRVIRRSVFEGLEFPVGKLHEDEFTAHRILHAARRVVLVDRCLYYYRQHPRSIMGSGFKVGKATDAIEAYADRLGFLREIGRVDLLPLARAQLFRKHMALFRGISRGPQSDALRAEMRLLARDMRRSRDRSAFVAFASAYAWLPQLMDLLYSAYNKVSTRTRPGRVPE